MPDPLMPELGGPPPMGPAAPPGPPPAPPLTLSEEDLAKWRTRISRAQELRDTCKQDWQAAIDSYRGKPLKLAPTEDWVNLNRDYSNVRLKQALLFYKTPEVQLSPMQPLMQGREASVTTFGAVLNAKLGVRDLNAKAMVDRTLFLALTCGIGPTMIGYKNVTKTVMIDQPDPTGQMQVDPMTGQMMPATVQVPTQVPIHERYFWEEFSPLRLLLPHDFQGDAYDSAVWIGMEFDQDLLSAKREFNLPDDFQGSAGKVPKLTGEDSPKTLDDTVHGTVVFFKAAYFDEAITNPDLLRELVLVDGLEEPARYRDFPHQTLKEDGTLTSDSMLGFPIHPLCLNFVADVAYPPSDAIMAKPLNLEQCKGRTQMIQQRDRSLPMRWADLTRVGGDEGLKKVTQGINQGLVPLENYDANNPPIGEIARAQYPRENFTFNDIIERDLAQLWHISANQRGAEMETVRTATEATIMQGNTDVAMQAERQKVIDWFVKGVGKLACLLQRYADAPDYVEVVGPSGEKAMQAWDKTTIAGKFAFQIRPDSSIYVDAATYRKQMLDLYNFIARDPNANRVEVLKELVRAFGHTPETLIAPTVPAKPPEPNVSFRFSGADLDPTMPQFAIVMDILKKSGLEVTPAAIQEATREALARATAMPPPAAPGGESPGAPAGPAPPQGHPGMAEQVEPINKHFQTDQTGGMPGMPPK